MHKEYTSFTQTQNDSFDYNNAIGAVYMVLMERNIKAVCVYGTSPVPFGPFPLAK